MTVLSLHLYLFPCFGDFEDDDDDDDEEEEEEDGDGDDEDEVRSPMNTPGFVYAA